MEIQVNGKKMELEQAVTLEELVTMLKHDKRQIAAEVNLEIIEKDKYTEVMLKEGDVVVLTVGVPLGRSGNTNLLKATVVGEY